MLRQKYVSQKSVGWKKSRRNYLLFSRPDINDWETGSTTHWRHQMFFPADAFFGSCQALTFERDSLPSKLWIEFLGYYNRDHIQVRTCSNLE